MNRTKTNLTGRLATFASSLTFGILASSAADYGLLTQEYKLAGERNTETQHYLIESAFVHYKEDGQRDHTDTFRCILSGKSQGEGAEAYQCEQFTVQLADQPERTIPVLNQWKYQFERTSSGLDKKGQVFGIPHEKFQNLEDEAGAKLPDDATYKVYNTFIDFHAFCNNFAQATSTGKGIQDLREIGQKIVHDSAYSKPSVELGKVISEGSVFTNGEITLLFKGISLVKGRPCAIVSFDSGESSFKMDLKPAPNIEVAVRGGSHYLGDLFIDFESKWVKQVLMNEIVVHKVTMAGQKIANGVVERATTIRSIDESELAENK